MSAADQTRERKSAPTPLRPRPTARLVMFLLGVGVAVACMWAFLFFAMED